MKNCPKCHTANSDEANFCRSCGAAFQPANKPHTIPKSKGGVPGLLQLLLVLSGLFLLDLIIGYSNPVTVDSLYSSYDADPFRILTIFDGRCTIQEALPFAIGAFVVLLMLAVHFKNKATDGKE